jgi:alkaline phosphatase
MSKYRSSLITAGLFGITLFASAANAAGEAKNVIFFLGDGMGPTTVTASRIYAYGEAGSLNMDKLKRTARIKTFSKDAQTTDSAPSMAAYMTGVKMNNEVISMSADTVAWSTAGGVATALGSRASNTCNTIANNGSPVPTILESAIAKGKATGVVTTARLTHATPAATYAHICNRNAENDIASQAVPTHANFNKALGKGVDVLMGGDSTYWQPKTGTMYNGRSDNVNLITAMQSSGYNYVYDLNTFNAAPVASGTKLLGLFDQAGSQGHMSYDADRDPTKEPSLAEMTKKAIDILSKNGSGYFLMVEGGRIDHALHGTNAYRALTDTIAFDNAIKVALDNVDLSNTLVIVTADHDHTMAFNGYPSKGNPILGKADNYVNVKKGIPALSSGDKLPYTTLVFGNGSGNGSFTANGGATRLSTRADLTNIDTTTKDFNQEYGVQTGSTGAGSETHGGGDVMLFSSGAGSSIFKGTLDNTKVYSLIKSAFGF